MKLVIAWLLGVPVSLTAMGTLLSVSRADLLGPPPRREAVAPAPSRPAVPTRIEEKRPAVGTAQVRTTISWAAPSGTRPTKSPG